MKYLTVLLTVTLICCFLEGVYSACADNRERCEWGVWGSFQECTRTCGGGRMFRERTLCCKSGLTTDECLEDCNLESSGFKEYSDCNQVCVNEYFSGSRCVCGERYHGDCCEHDVDCGRPADISNGGFHGDSFYGGDAIEYYCNEGYELRDGDVTHSCKKLFSSYSYWKGEVPYCAYIQTCETSKPCQNGECHNKPDGYTCECDTGWSGTNCEFDVVPPSMVNCPAHKTYRTSEARLNVNWTEPQFWDPQGKEVLVSSNYPDSSGELPWGRHVVQYVADKISNGMRTECAFTVTVLPNPCSPLPPPVNGAYACNGWNAEYTEVCKLFCQVGYDVSLGTDINTLFVCGATGNWIPQSSNTGCPETTLESDDDNTYGAACSESVDQIGRAYIDVLKRSDLSYMCTADEWKDDCKPENVHILC